MTTSGWRELIEKNQNNTHFIDLLRSVNFFEASHHGREEGFSRDLFNYATPYLVFVSDKKEQDTSARSRYGGCCEGFSVFDEIQLTRSNRRVLTTRYMLM
jgi:hypothetical protein